MTEPFTGEIQLFGFNFAPIYWATCSGQTVQIQQNSALFSLIGTTFGGDGRQTFQLPNLVNRVPCGAGNGPGLSSRTLGETFGENSVALDSTTMAPHTHTLKAYSGGGGTAIGTPVPTSALGLPGSNSLYGSGALDTAMAPTAITSSGSGVPHENRQPMLAINYCIALFGNFPQFP